MGGSELDGPTPEEVAEAARILAAPAQQYEYRDENYRGGPRRLTEDAKLAASIEIITARVLVDELTDRLEEARIALYDACQEQLDQGVPVELVAEHSGLDHRASVYRALKRLPEMKAKRVRKQQIRSQTRRTR